MNLEEQTLEFINEILKLDDVILEEGYNELIELIDLESSFEQATTQKIAHCRAYGLTEDDLIEENNVAKELIEKEFEKLSPIKKELFSHIINSGARINNLIIEKGLYPKIKIRVQKLSDDINLPEYAHEKGDSGLDIKLLEDIILESRTTQKVKTGIKVVIPLGYEIQIRPKSGVSLNYQDLIIGNSPGTIDSNFRKEIEIILKNIGPETMFFGKGMKIAQIVLAPVIKLEWVEIDDVNVFPTSRVGGFGSTGV